MSVSIFGATRLLLLKIERIRTYASQIRRSGPVENNILVRTKNIIRRQDTATDPLIQAPIADLLLYVVLLVLAQVRVFFLDDFSAACNLPREASSEEHFSPVRRLHQFGDLPRSTLPI